MAGMPKIHLHIMQLRIHKFEGASFSVTWRLSSPMVGYTAYLPLLLVSFYLLSIDKHSKTPILYHFAFLRAMPAKKLRFNPYQMNSFVIPRLSEHVN
jgi:hypothetical protein